MEKTIIKDEFLNILSEYFTNTLEKEVTVYDNPKVIYTDTDKLIDLQLYHLYFFDKNRTTIRIETPISDFEVSEVLNEYAHKMGYELDRFQYIGHVRNVGYYTDEDTVVFEGVKLYLNEPNIKMIMRKE